MRRDADARRERGGDALAVRADEGDLPEGEPQSEDDRRGEREGEYDGEGLRGHVPEALRRAKIEDFILRHGPCRKTLRT